MWPASPVGPGALPCPALPRPWDDTSTLRLPGAAVLRSAGQSDAFVAKYGPDGALQRR